MSLDFEADLVRLGGMARGARYRVFRHEVFGIHCVVRNRDQMDGYRSVYGPWRDDGTRVTFDEAVAWAHEAFARWCREHGAPAQGESLFRGLSDGGLARGRADGRKRQAIE